MLAPNEVTRVCGSVQGKMECLYESIVLAETSSKRPEQSYRVIASDIVRQSALLADIKHARASEKVDGTCVYVGDFMGTPWLWPRHDRKPIKSADKRFQTFTQQHRAWQQSQSAGNDVNEPHFQWNTSTDFRDTPPHWIPAAKTDVPADTVLQPDLYGRISGWVPLQANSRLHCWHLSAVDLNAGTVLVLEKNHKAEVALRIVEISLQELLGSTMELIGTHVNSNPYGIGSKKQPIHVFVRHGQIPFDSTPPLNYEQLNNWFQSHPEGKVEGIVWHCSGGEMFKIHRHHFNLKWPMENLKLNTYLVLIDVNPTVDTDSFVRSSQFASLAKLNGRIFNSVSSVAWP